MKHCLLLLTFLSVFAYTTQAQNKAAAPQSAPVQIDEAAARAATEKLTAKYQLTPDQQKTMLEIQMRKQRNLAQLEPIKASQPDVYRSKMQGIQKGTLNSIDRLLTTEEQRKLFNNTKVDTRTRQAEKRKELTMQGASKEAIEDAMLEIYAE